MLQRYDPDAPQPIRVAILDCENVPTALVEKYGPFFSNMFIARFEAALKRSQDKHQFEFTAWNILADQYPDPSDVDAVMVTGADVSVYDQNPWVVKLGNYVADVYRHHPRIKLFGVCLGHQLMAHAILGKHGVHVEKNPRGAQWGLRSVELNPGFCEYFPESIPSPRTLHIHVVHGDHVFVPPVPLPPGWMSIGRTDCCDIHGLYQPNRVLTFQSHFEFDEHTCAECIRMVMEKQGRHSRETVEAEMRKAGPDDGDVIADVVLSFLTTEHTPMKPVESQGDSVEAQL